MATPSVATSTTLAFAGTAEQHVSSTEFYSTITVENATTVTVFVAIDGGTATAGGGHEEAVAPGAELAFENLETLPNPNGAPYVTQAPFNTNGSPRTPYLDPAFAPGWDAQNGDVGTSPTFCSVIPLSTVTGDVTVTFS